MQRNTWRRYWLPVCVWMALIFLGSSVPGREADTMTKEASGIQTPIEIQRIKDAVHIVEYAILALLLVRAFNRTTGAVTPRQALQSLAVASLYGVSDELHQLFVPLRSPGLDDVIRDMIGAALAIGVVMAFERVRKGRHEPENPRGFNPKSKI